MMKVLESYLRNFETGFKNPFLNKRFCVFGEDTYSNGWYVHRLDGVVKVYSNNKIKISFKRDNCVLGIYSVIFTVFGGYGLGNHVLMFNKSKIDNYNNTVDLFKKIYDKILLSDDKTVSVYVVCEDLNQLRYSMKILHYITDENYPDSYYFQKELKRWEAKDANDKII